MAGSAISILSIRSMTRNNSSCCGNNACFYIHGHSAGGTNPSLVEAMSCGAPILAFDVGYNRETTGHKACYWSTPEELAALASESREDTSGSMERLANECYTWRKVVGQYEAIY